MVVTTGGFQSCRGLTSGMSKVRREPSAEPDPAATRRAPRAMMRSFLGWRQNGILDGGLPEGPDGGPPVGGPTTRRSPPWAPLNGGAPGLAGAGSAGFGRSRLLVVKGPRAARKAA